MEFHPGKSMDISRALSAAGLDHHRSAQAGYGYEVLVASRTPLGPSEGSMGAEASVGGYLEVRVPAHGLMIAGVYVPVISAVPLAEKRRFWRMLHDAARRRLQEPFVLVGDLNTGDFPLDKERPGRPFSCTPEYRQMAELGMVEAWRVLNGGAQEYSWRSNQGGWLPH